MANGRLPAHFRVRNEFGVRGGIDPAFMSTTLDARVAGQYVGATGVVFHIQQGMVDRGADISWLSQARPPTTTTIITTTPTCARRRSVPRPPHTHPHAPSRLKPPPRSPLPSSQYPHEREILFAPRAGL